MKDSRDIFKTGLRTNLCGVVNMDFIEKKVIICGWVSKRRDHGKLIFADIRDFSGIVQVVFNPAFNAKAYEFAKDLRSEFVVQISGIVKKRSP